MALKVAFQMDPIERIDIRGDSTFALLLEAQWRGHDVFYYTPNNLSLRDGKLIAEGHSLTVEDKPGDALPARASARGRSRRISTWCICARTRPSTWPISPPRICSSASTPRPLVVNDPAAVRNAPEKVFVLDFLDLMPPTLVTRSPEQISAFRDEHKDIVVKPLYGNGGAAIFRIPARRHQSQLADRAAGHHLPRADHGAALSSRGARGRQAHHPGRRRGRRRHQPRAGARRDALQSACRRHGAADHAHQARQGDLRAARARAEEARADLHRHRRDRRLSHRDQRHLADRHQADRRSSAATTSPP